ncbi:MAG TPA: tetratricopeptide repeat protein [Rhodanobacteraceae bacterium]|nr:tetratricopeptide repeat protein [Rhodanobacteraceae bacterium]
MHIPSPHSLQRLQEASTLLQAGNTVQARAVLEALLRSDPGLVEGHRLLAGALQASGDVAAAERVLRRALTIDPRWAPTHVALGEILAQTGRIGEAEQSLRTGIAANRNYARAAVSLAGLLLDTDRAAEAIAITAAPVAAATATPDLLTEHARALMALKYRDEAVAAYRKVVDASPASGLAELNLAAALVDSGRHALAESAARRALAKGFDTSKTWLVLSFALFGQDRFDECEAVLRHALNRWPLYVEAHRELAQLVWMRTGQLETAAGVIDTALRAHPEAHALSAVKARLHEFAGDVEGAYAIATGALAIAGDDAMLHRRACEAALKFDAARALDHARRAAALAPTDRAISGLLAEALLGTGNAERAAELAGAALAQVPGDQHMIAVQATAWRMLGDSRYRTIYDYDRLVRGWTIDTPEGWSDLTAYLADLARSLRRLHGLETHPIGQSLRHGTQTTGNLALSDDPAIRAFFSAIAGPIRRHLAGLGVGEDYRIAGIWSVELKPNGYHANHMHPEGYLSSACYIDLPDAVHADGCQGWIKFGEPPLLLDPPLAPEHFVKPEPGLLVLFPSHMWHGTVPFSGEQSRLTIAFDVLPGAHRDTAVGAA